MRSQLPALAVLAIGLLTSCTDAGPAESTAARASAPVAWEGPSGLETESEDAARVVVEGLRAEAERLAAEAATRAAAEQSAAQRAAEEAAAQAVIDAEGGCPPGWYFDDALGCTSPEGAGEGDDGYVSSDLEVRCSDGTATIEECFGPGSDLNRNGIADVNE